MLAVIEHRDRIDHAAALEGQAVLAGEIGDVLRLTEPERMRSAFGKTRIEQRLDVCGRDRTVGDAALGRPDLDHRLQPEQAARSGADDLDIEPATFGAGGDGFGDAVGAETEGDGVAGNVDRDAHDAISFRAASRPSAVRRATGRSSTRAPGPLAQSPRQ